MCNSYTTSGTISSRTEGVIVARDCVEPLMTLTFAGQWLENLHLRVVQILGSTQQPPFRLGRASGLGKIKIESPLHTLQERET